MYVVIGRATVGTIADTLHMQDTGTAGKMAKVKVSGPTKIEHIFSIATVTTMMLDSMSLSRVKNRVLTYPRRG